MVRRKEKILDTLAEAPWWVSVVVAGMVFLVLRYILSGISGDNLVLKSVARAAPIVAPWAALFFLIPAPISAYRSWRKSKLLDGQKDLDGIRSLNWRAFEQLVGEAYRRQGYAVRENTGVGPDGGVDLVLKKEGNTYLVQCKQWRS
jgi:restriction system protein